MNRLRDRAREKKIWEMCLVYKNPCKWLSPCRIYKGMTWGVIRTGLISPVRTIKVCAARPCKLYPTAHITYTFLMFCLGHKNTLDSPQILLKVSSKQDGLYMSRIVLEAWVSSTSPTILILKSTFSLVLLMNWRSYLAIITSNGTLTQRTCKSAQIPSWSLPWQGAKSRIRRTTARKVLGSCSYWPD